MKDKKSNNKKESKCIFQSSKTIKNIYDAKYDLSQLQILTVDGVIPFIDSEESRLLFFHNIPSVAINDDEEKKCLNICLAEIRMTTPTLRMINELLSYELQCFEKNHSDDKNCELKIKNHENFMFG